MKVFISHSSKDKSFVEQLATDLRTREGIDAWLDKWEILPGNKIPRKLEEGLMSANIFLLVLSPESISSQWVSYEKDAWLTAQINEEVLAEQELRTPNRRLIPVLYKDCETPLFLQSILHINPSCWLSTDMHLLSLNSCDRVQQSWCLAPTCRCHCCQHSAT